MRNVLSDLVTWIDEEREVAQARVVAVHGSAPRRPGAAMIVSSTGDVRGSLRLEAESSLRRRCDRIKHPVPLTRQRTMSPMPWPGPESESIALAG